MTKRELYRMLRDLRRFREAFSWDIPRRPDALRIETDGVIAQVRRVIRAGGSYQHPVFQVKAERGA